MAETVWFKRLKRELPSISPRLRLVRIKFGFYRIYFDEYYVHEVCEDMKEMGYDIYEYDPRFESRGYYEEYEDQAELTMKLKNYREGYRDTVDKLRKRVYMLRNNEEHRRQSAMVYANSVMK